jgi:hypothetical protein
MTPIHFLGDLREIDKGDLACGHFVAKRPSFGRFDSGGAKRTINWPNGKVMVVSKSCRAFQTL